jgi:NAD(P)H-dependent FMN reductase
MNIEIISGSPRTNSVTSRVAVFLHNYFRGQSPQHSLSLLDMRHHVLPFVQTVWSKPEHVPAEWQTLSERMFAADAFVIVSPEYNGGYSPALKNLFDHFPKQSRKPFGIVTASPGMQGGMRAAQQLFLMTTALWGIPSPQLLIVPEVDKKFDEQGNMSDAGFQKNVETFAKEFLWLAESLVKK